MNDSTVNMLIPKTQYGSIDIKAVLKKYYEGFWKERFDRTDCKEIYSSPKRAVYKDYFIDKAEDIVNALNLWLSPANAEVVDKKEERRLNNFLTTYLYNGDISLGLDYDDNSTPKGLSALIANCVAYKKELRSLYYHYLKIDGTAKFSDALKRFDFAKIIIENLRFMLVDIWNYDLFLEKLEDDDSKYELIKIIESNFCEYFKVSPYVRCLRILKMLESQNALPEVKSVSEKQHLLACFLEKALKLRGKDLITKFIEDLAPDWNKHIAVENIEKEENAERFNNLMTQIIENLSFGDLKEAEHRKNRESGDKARKLRNDIKKCEDLLLSNNMTPKKYKDLVERKKELIEELKSINGISLSLEDESVGLLKIDVAYCPDDYSEEIWNDFNDDVKLFLITTELCDSLKTKAGYKGILQDKIRTPMSCIPLNIMRAILSKIKDKNLEEDTTDKKDKSKDKALEPATIATKETIKKETQKLMANPSNAKDVSYTLKRIMDTKVRKILAGKEELDLKTRRMLEIAFGIAKELKNK